MATLRNILLAACAAFPAAFAFAADPAELRLSAMEVARVDNQLDITLTVDVSDIRPGRDREVVFTPVLLSQDGTDSLVLDPVSVAGRNRYLLAERHGFAGADGRVFQAGAKTPASIHSRVDFLPWMMTSRLEMRRQTANCCDPLVQHPTLPLAEMDFNEHPFEPPYGYVALTGDSVVELTAEGRAYVDFVVNHTEIKPTYRRNRVEIAKIIESIDRVRNDSMAIITGITIKGFASPEGPYANNVRLAIGRTESLKEYVRRHYNFPLEIMHTNYEPEDWAGLRAWVEGCRLPNRRGILEIIDSDMEPDPKDHLIRSRYPQEYRLMLDSIYPALRHSDYTVRYAIKTTIDIEQLKATMATAPERLRPVDFYRIATSYPEGSEGYEQALMKAVEIWPADAQANINAANIAIRRGDLVAAARYIDRGGESAEAIYTRAAIAGRQGDHQRAGRLLEQAVEMGLEKAAEQLQVLRTQLARPKVNYLYPVGALPAR